MKRILVGAVASIAVAGSALAADIPAPVYKAAPVVVPFSWTGFYVGGHFGGAWGTKDWFEDATRSGSGGAEPAGFQDASYNANGYFGGGQLGFKYQAGWAVFGAEVDASWASITGGTGTGNCFAGVAGTTQTCTTNITGLGTATGLLGAAFDRYLVFVKGGGAWMREKYANSCDVCFGVGGIWSAAETRAGWTVGAGLEYAFERNWSIKVEWDYFDLGTKNLAFTGPTPPGPAGNYTEDIRQRFYVIKTGINYRFDWGAAPVVSKY